MSMHYIYIECTSCHKTESIYTGNIETEDFDDGNWEGETISVLRCRDCKSMEAGETTDSSQKPTAQEDLRIILKFLHGSGQLDGYWFGDTPTDRPKYWWRPKLLDAMTKYEAEANQREREARIDELARVGFDPDYIVWTTGEDPEVAMTISERITELKSQDAA